MSKISETCNEKHVYAYVHKMADEKTFEWGEGHLGGVVGTGVVPSIPSEA